MSVETAGCRASPWRGRYEAMNSIFNADYANLY